MVLIALLACVPKTALILAPSPLPVDVVVVMDPLDNKAVQAAPEDLESAVLKLLTERQLNAHTLPSTDWLSTFSSRRTSAQRMAWMVEHPGAGEVQLLVESSAQFYSQMNGRYRWTVQVHATLHPKAAPEQEAQTEFEVPVFLDFDHEREDAAIIAAIPVITHRLNAILDAWLSGL